MKEEEEEEEEEAQDYLVIYSSSLLIDFTLQTPTISDTATQCPKESDFFLKVEITNVTRS